MKRIAASALAVIMTILCVLSFGCDPRGSLTDEETQRLYDEYRELVSADETWNQVTSTWISTELQFNGGEQAAVQLLRSVAEKSIDDETEKEVSGAWSSGVDPVSLLHIVMDGPYRPGDTREDIRTMITARKTKSGEWGITVNDIEPTSDVWFAGIDVWFGE